ncbi:MAG: hypothetical protein ACI9Y1_002475 [Lentisphaeria bacterium]|jgi:hypothetical protein
MWSIFCCVKVTESGRGRLTWMDFNPQSLKCQHIYVLCQLFKNIV